MKYKKIKIRTAVTKNEVESGLSFLEGEQDIPFHIKRVYCIYETEGKKYCGFNAKERNQYFLFCPYGEIDVLLDDGMKREMIALNEPSIGVILNSDIWCEIVWMQKSSVLCVAAHDCYDLDQLCGDYMAYLKFIDGKERLSE